MQRPFGVPWLQLAALLLSKKPQTPGRSTVRLVMGRIYRWRLELIPPRGSTHVEDSVVADLVDAQRRFGRATDIRVTKHPDGRVWIDETAPAPNDQTRTLPEPPVPIDNEGLMGFMHYLWIKPISTEPNA